MAARFEPTPEQRLAATDFDHSIVVTAGAGAGKTRVLVERYINLIKTGKAKVGEIIAITFTNKAAGEMLDRVRKAIDEEIEKASEENEKRYWCQVKEELSGAAISTFHSLCSRILRENPVEASVDPGFSILDDAEAKILLNEAVREEILSGLENDDELASLIEAFRYSRLLDNLGFLYEKIRRTGASMEEAEAETLRSLGRDLGEIGPACVGALDAYERLIALCKTSDLSGKSAEKAEMLISMGPDFKAALSALSALAESAAAMGLAESAAPLRLVEATESAEVSGLAEAVGAAGKREITAEDSEIAERWKILKEASAASDAPAAAERRRRVSECLEVFTAAREILKGNRAKSVEDAFKSLAEAIEGLYVCCADILSREYLEKIFSLLKGIDRRYSAKKRRMLSLDYNDLELKALALLKDDGNRSIVEGYRERCRYLMVDEFQDTNPVQAEIVSLLTGDPPGKRLFVVGDPKQSIYRFRGTDVSLFSKEQGRISGYDGLSISLRDNFRSCNRIIDFCNYFFAKLMGDAGVGESAANAIPYERIRGRREMEGNEPCIELVRILNASESEDEADGVPEEAESEDAGRKEAEADAIAGRIREIVEEGRQIIFKKGADGAEGYAAPEYRDFAILLRAMTDVKLYEKALRRHGVPYYVVGGGGFYDKQEVQDAINALKAINDPADTVALAAYLRSPFAGISDEGLLYLAGHEGGIAAGLFDPDALSAIDESEGELLAEARELILHLRGLKDRIAISEILDRLIKETGYEAVIASRDMGKQRAGNIRKFVELVRSYESGMPLTIGDFLEKIDDLMENSAREAEAVIEAEEENTVKIMTIHKSKGLEFPVVIVPDMGRNFLRPSEDFCYEPGYGLGMKIPKRKGGRLTTSLWKRCDEINRYLDYEENKRIFYVAVTRAKDYLILSGIAKDGSEEKGLKKARSWMDWVEMIIGAEGVKSEPGGLSGSESLILLPNEDGEPIKIRAVSISEVSAGALQPLSFGAQGTSENLMDEIAVAAEVEGSLDTEALDMMIRPVAVRDFPYFSTSVSRMMAFKSCRNRYVYQYVIGIPEREAPGASDSGFGFVFEDRDYRINGFIEGSEVEEGESFTAEGPNTGQAGQGGVSGYGGPSGYGGFGGYGEASGFGGFGGYGGASGIGRSGGLFSGIRVRSMSEVTPIIRGNIVHKICERMKRRDELDILMENVFAEEGIDEPLFPDLKEALKGLLDNYIGSEAFKVIENGGEGLEVRNELPFTLKVGDSLISGVVDRVVTDRAGRARIYDFKTNKLPKDEVKKAALDYEIQMKVYALALHDIWGIRVEEAILFFMDPNEVYRWRFDGGSMDNIRREAEELLAAIKVYNSLDEAGRSTDAGRCEYCGYRILCGR